MRKQTMLVLIFALMIMTGAQHENESANNSVLPRDTVLYYWMGHADEPVVTTVAELMRERSLDTDEMRQSRTYVPLHLLTNLPDGLRLVNIIFDEHGTLYNYMYVAEDDTYVFNGSRAQYLTLAALHEEYDAMRWFNDYMLLTQTTEEDLIDGKYIFSEWNLTLYWLQDDRLFWVSMPKKIPVGRVDYLEPDLSWLSAAGLVDEENFNAVDFLLQFTTTIEINVGNENHIAAWEAGDFSAFEKKYATMPDSDAITYTLDNLPQPCYVNFSRHDHDFNSIRHNIHDVLEVDGVRVSKSISYADENYFDVNISLDENPLILELGVNLLFDSEKLTLVSISKDGGMTSFQNILPEVEGSKYKPDLRMFHLHELFPSDETGLIATMRFRTNGDIDQVPPVTLSHLGLTHPDRKTSQVDIRINEESPPVLPDPDKIEVIINDAPQSFEVAPRIIDGRAMFPLREIGEALGTEIAFDPATNTATITAEGLTAAHILHTNEITVNGEVSVFNYRSAIAEGRTLMPLMPIRILAEAVGAKVNWNGATRTAMIDTN
jgi:hypothetical protein